MPCTGRLLCNEGTWKLPCAYWHTGKQPSCTPGGTVPCFVVVSLGHIFSMDSFRSYHHHYVRSSKKGHGDAVLKRVSNN